MSLDEKEVIIGEYYGDIICESFLDRESSRIRVRPAEGGLLPSHFASRAL